MKNIRRSVVSLKKTATGALLLMKRDTVRYPESVQKRTDTPADKQTYLNSLLERRSLPSRSEKYTLTSPYRFGTTYRDFSGTWWHNNLPAGLQSKEDLFIARCSDMQSDGIDGLDADSNVQNANVGYISILNHGGYVAQFTVSYDIGGKRYTKVSGNYTAGVRKTIEIPAGATNIIDEANAAWFIASWNNIFTKHFNGPVIKSYRYLR